MQTTKELKSKQNEKIYELSKTKMKTIFWQTQHQLALVELMFTLKPTISIFDKSFFCNSLLLNQNQTIEKLNCRVHLNFYHNL